MHIYSITDNNAGNRRQADALASALLKNTDSLHFCRLQANIAARAFSPRLFPGAIASLGSTFSQLLDQPPQLAIGCGRQAALATRLLHRRGWHAVQILNPRLPTRYWDIVVAPEHDQIIGDNVITVLGSLNPVDDQWLQQARQQFPHFDALPKPITTVLIGGSTHHSKHSISAYEPLVQQLKNILKHGGSLLLTTSRRTDPTVANWLRQELGSFTGLMWIDEKDGTNPYAAFLAYADRIICTADSVNMLSEACATYAPVYIYGLNMASKRPQLYIDKLLNRQRAYLMDNAISAKSKAIPIRETTRIANLIKHRLNITP